jgi:hypothetical protein
MESTGSSFRKSFLFFEDDVLKASCPGSSGCLNWRGGERRQDVFVFVLALVLALVCALDGEGYGGGQKPEGS